MRIREVETEHYLMDIQGMFYELQPIAFQDSHLGRQADLPAPAHHSRLLRLPRPVGRWAATRPRPTATTTRCPGSRSPGIWFGKTDDLWSWGKPAGWGGPWRRTSVKKDVPSDPFLMTGFDKKVLHLKSYDRPGIAFRIEIDFLGDGDWTTYDRVEAAPYKPVFFPAGFSAHWVRLIAEQDGVASAEFIYT